MDLKILLASKVRQRILNELSEPKELHMMTLVNKVGAKYNEVNRNIKLLEIEGIITNEYHNKPKHPRTRIIKLQNNPRTQKLLLALNNLKEDDTIE